MENASKALLMTGSILIGIILLSIGVYIFRIMGESQKAQTSQLTEEQLVKYNMEYTAYNKSLMYGTDVISVLNKAIDNNDRNSGDESMYINIEFKLKDNVSVAVVPYTWNEKTKKYEAGKTTKTKASGNDKYTYNFEAGKTYSLKNDKGEDTDTQMIRDFLATSKDGTAIKKPANPGIGENYTITYTGFSDFKRMIFKCTKVQYNEVGKISYMKFEQRDSSTY